MWSTSFDERQHRGEDDFSRERDNVMRHRPVSSIAVHCSSGAVMPLLTPAKAREYVFTGVGLSVYLSVCDHDN